MTANLLLIWHISLGLLASVLFPGTLELLLLTAAGIVRPRQRFVCSFESPYALTVVIPAHDEELLIERSLSSIFAADREGIALQVIVIADNCTDQTARRARAAGAQVLERNNPARRGKGQALYFAFEALALSGAEAFAVVDADSEIDRAFLVETARALRSGADATQSRYLVRGSDSLRNSLIRLASGAYNVLRARGRAVLGFSAGIYGNGFALAAHTLASVPYQACSIVEDIEYHLALLEAGRRVTFLDHSAVYADLPFSNTGAESQRARWDGGRLRVALTKLPSVTVRILRGNFAMFEAGLDLTLLPLVFHALLLLLVSASPFAGMRWFGIAGLVVILFHLTAAAFVAGRGFRDLAALAAVPLFVLWKLLLIPRLLQTSKVSAEWIRTERAPEVGKR